MKIFGFIQEMLEQSDMKDGVLDHMAENLKVFCVSSLDYQKATLSQDEEPKVRFIVLLILAALYIFCVKSFMF